MPSTAIPSINGMSTNLKASGTKDKRTVVHALRTCGHEAGEVLGGGNVGHPVEARRTHRSRDEFVTANVVPVVDDVVIVCRRLLLGYSGRTDISR